MWLIVLLHFVKKFTAKRKVYDRSFIMPAEYEIERKFLVKLPDMSKLDIRRKFHIIQTYLKSGENGSQRRVRKIEENGSVSYSYTEKVFLTPVTREENEYEIIPQEYAELCKELREGCVPVEKTRFCFEYAGQLFELDVYPYSDRLAILELELSSSEQEIFFPPYINVIKDVSADSRYSNAALAAAGDFPDERMEKIFNDGKIR